MTDVLLFHHVQGLTPGVRSLAAAIAGQEHTVFTPDLYDGRTFTTIAAGLAHAKSLDADAVDRRVDQIAASFPDGLVYAGLSWGVHYAQRLAQTRSNVAGAVLLEACHRPDEDGFGPWPSGLPAQIHGMDDAFFVHDGDLQAARQLIAAADHPLATVFTYPGDRHLVCDDSLPSYDPHVTALLIKRVRTFWGSCDIDRRRPDEKTLSAP